jgi:uncharacterized protein involved in copper resistance
MNHEGMDHGSMEGMDHGSMKGMDHGSMEGMDHDKMMESHGSDKAKAGKMANSRAIAAGSDRFDQHAGRNAQLRAEEMDHSGMDHSKMGHGSMQMDAAPSESMPAMDHSRRGQTGKACPC